MDIRFDGKRVLVTGAGKGIGRALTLKLVELGADVVAVSRTQSDLDELTALSEKIEAVFCDVGEWDATQEALRDLQPVDLLVNNAGIMPPGQYGEYDEQQVDRVLDINLKAVINVTQVVLSGMKERGGGSIVNVSSVVGIRPVSRFGIYSVSKGALDTMTRSMAIELGQDNIRVNSVNPTSVRTRMAVEKGAFEEGNPLNAMLMDKTPLRRLAEPEDVVYPILFLLSDFSSMVTGTIFPVDGGITLSLI